MQSLTRTHLNDAGQATHLDEYFSFDSLTYSTSASLGTEGTHFYRTELAYDNRGRQHRTELADGAILRTVFDGLGRPVSEWIGDNDTPVSGSWSPTNPADMIKLREYEYDGGGVGDSLLTAMTDGLGRTTSPEYDFRGRIIEVTLPDPDDTGPLLPPVISTTHDNLGRTVSQTDPLGNVTTFVYDTANRKITTTLADPDHAGQLVSPVLTQGFDNLGLLISQTDPLGNVTTRAYDGAGRLIKMTLPDPDSPGSGASSPILQWSYDGVGNVRFTTDPLGNETERQYDKANRLNKIIGEDPDAGGSLSAPETLFSYDAAGFLQSQTDPLGNATSFTHDALGRTLTTTLPDPDGGGSQVAGVYTNTYDEVGRVLTVTNPLSHTTSYQYDVQGRRTKITDAELGETAFTYDVMGNLLTLTDPVANTTTWVYDDLDRVIEETNELLKTRYFSYDAASNLIERIDRNNRKIEFAFDNLHRTINERWGNNAAFPAISVATTADGVTADEIQRVGFVDTEMEISGGTFTLTYDSQTTSDIDWNASAAAVQAELEALSNIGSGDVAVTKLADESDHQEWQIAFQGALAATNTPQTTIDTFDVWGLSLTDIQATDTQGVDVDEEQVVTISDATGGTFTLAFGGETTTALAYDATAAQVETALEALTTIDDVTVTGAAGGPFTITFQGTHSGQNVGQIHADGWSLTNANLERTLSFQYDAASRLTAASDPAAAFTYTHDNLGRRTSVLHDLAGLSFDVELISEYDAASNRTDLKALVGGTADFWNEYFYDNLNRTTSIEQHGAAGGASVAEKRIDFTYDAAGQWDTITRYADVAGMDVVATSTYTFDDAQRLTALTHAKGINVLADYDWSYDAANRVTQFVSATDGTVNYSYDDTDQLVGADFDYQSDETYNYDANGNRTNTGYSTGDDNQLTSDGTYNYEYDDEGNRTKKTEIATGDYVVYEWDHRNRLTAVRFKDASQNLIKQVEYDYDIFNRRIGKRVDADGDNTYESAQRFVYDGQDIVLVFDDTGSLANRYLHGPAVDQILATEDAAGDVLWPLADNQGTIRDVAAYDAVMDDTSVVKHLTYAAFGQIRTDSAPTVDFLYAYTGREWDPDAELFYYRARWYDGTTGRFLSEDPVGFAASDANLNRYVHNSPANYIDPTGNYSGAENWEWPSSATPAGMTEEEKLILGLTQLALDIGGIFEPTPFCDAGSAGIAIYKGEIFDAGVSVFSMFPWLGDTAKLAKIPKYMALFGTLAAAAAKNPSIASKAEPILASIVKAFDAVPWDCVSKKLAEKWKQVSDSAKMALEKVTLILAKNKYAGQTVGEILKNKLGSIKNAPLPKGSPSWNDIKDMTWEQIEAAAKANKPGYKTIKKLLSNKAYDK